MKTQMHKKMLGLFGALLLIPILGWIDWQTGYKLNFFVFYFIPISITAWFFGIESAIIISIISSLVWFIADKLSGHTYSSNLYLVWNTSIRLVSFMIIGWSVSKVSFLFRSEEKKTEELQKALSEIKILEAFLSICCVCKKIRNEDGKWQQIETYISNHSETKFSHSYCPECAKKAMQEAGLIEK
ncbi:MAG: hypothetical protein ABIN18_25885 [Pseudomonadota bacterium]